VKVRLFIVYSKAEAGARDPTIVSWPVNALWRQWREDVSDALDVPSRRCGGCGRLVALRDAGGRRAANQVGLGLRS
jgi:hypothetical protein